MLNKQHRLTTAECRDVFISGKKVHTKDVLVLYTETAAFPKCVVVVSKKLVKTAVARNRIRRQWYAALETSDYFEVFPARHTAFIIKADALSFTSSEIAHFLKQTLFP